MMGCWCTRCDEELNPATDGASFWLARRHTTMILCPDCGNKRCPHATNHRLACTRSNEPGQAGSRYA